jgi:N utilization substance protein A
VQSVVQELRGEKIDIVPFSDDQAKYVCSALSPAKVNRVFMDDDGRAMEVIVPDDQLSLAIGKKGQNVRLAVKLTGWKIDVKSESIAASQEEEGYKALMKIPGIDETTAEQLFNQGWKNVAALAAADIESLIAIEGISSEQIAAWVEEAGKLIDQERPTMPRQREKVSRSAGKMDV